MDTNNVVGWVSIAILDLGVISLLRVTLSGVNIRAVLREKDPGSQPTGTQAVADVAPGAAAPDPALDNTSYSRLSGFIGSVVLACFLWAIGNIVIYLAVTDIDKIPTFLNAIGTYFLAGASLFAPYAFNQVSKVFKPG